MRFEYYVVDAFAERRFGGNPAGVCVLDEWIDDEVMQAVAAENRLSETAFVVRQPDGGYELRWFTPSCEIDLCGHATFGAAHVLFGFHEQEAERIDFHATMKGYELCCERDGDMVRMTFPRIVPSPFSCEDDIEAALGARPDQVLATERDLICVFGDEEAVRAMRPRFELVAGLSHGLSVYVTAPAADYDYVARAFWPKIGIDEDPVCGSMQSALVPYWSQRLGTRELVCFEPSEREGTVWCRDLEDAVSISGHGRLYLRGEIEV
ncbi:PhzF family phenazine biosynthesis protein [Propionibacterium australiense]|uniref:Phenazine biosynthesis PhzF protein n=1 Tax=Propionibacterium australiense TaxID=119981 RepID=A0A383S818_9ACTN|nr:PhzF family phenazine biosynthesis protein [Propionibacterium australiense]RLP07626.1 PhzF family phenazine biosynthesis isomerase [Propionibacterium australiense]SYZ33983.1 Phenazine biosynthesis PhzF protein [Propionibacterium australiense]VEH88960.1 Uncharacterized isomerase yddE [Propionibacterium australiense]